MSEHVQEVKRSERFHIAYSLNNGTATHVPEEYKHLITIPEDIGFQRYEDYTERSTLIRRYIFYVKKTATPKIAEIQIDFIKEYEENGAKKYEQLKNHVSKVKIVE